MESGNERLGELKGQGVLSAEALKVFAGSFRYAPEGIRCNGRAAYFSEFYIRCSTGSGSAYFESAARGCRTDFIGHNLAAGLPPAAWKLEKFADSANRASSTNPG